MAFAILGSPKPAFFDSSGAPLVGGTLTVWEPSTDLPKATYATYDEAEVPENPNTNPITLDSRGECDLWGLDGEDYKLVLKDANGDTIWTTDDVFLALSSAESIGKKLYAQTAAEIAAGVTPTSYQYEPGDVRRYGAVGDGVTDDTAAINSAMSAVDAQSEGGGVVDLPAGNYPVASQIVVPPQVGLVGDGARNTVIQASGSFPADTAVISLGSDALAFDTYVKNLKVDCSDISGSIGVYSNRVSEQGGVFNCLIVDFKSKGIFIENQGASQAQNFRITDTEVFCNPTELSITGITRSGSTATATTSAAHGLSTNDVVTVDDANEVEYNGAFKVTGVPTTTTFTYEVEGTPTTPATGTIVWSETVGIHLDMGGATWRDIDNCSVTTRGLVVFAGTSIRIDGSGGCISNCHVESMTVGLHLGAASVSSGITTYNIDGGPNMLNVIQITSGQMVACIGTRRQSTGTTNTIKEVLNGVTLTDNQVACFFTGDGTAGSNMPLFSTSNDLTDAKLRNNMDLRSSVFKVDGNQVVGGRLAAITKLTDSTGGSANSTLVAISGSGDDADINNNFADLNAKLDTIIDRLGVSSGHGLTSD